jgi:Putative bacterial sensory transduction regulator
VIAIEELELLIMKKRIAIPLLAAALISLAPASNDPRTVNATVLRGYLDKMGLKYVPHPRNPDTLVVPRSENRYADRLDLYVEIGKENSLVLTAYAKSKGRYFNLTRAEEREKILQRLLEANHRSFATFFVDDQGDIGARFTFTVENGVGFESFRVAVIELLRIADEYTPILNEYMRKDEAEEKKQSEAPKSKNE